MTHSQRRRMPSSFLLPLCIWLGFCAEETPAQELIWSEEFSSGNLDTGVWSYDTGGGGWGNDELQTYTESSVQLDGDNLVIEIEAPDGSFTSGRIKTTDKLEFLYGTVEARIKLPDVAGGLWPCFWMLGANFPQVGWPQSGSFTIVQAGSADALENGEADTTVGSAAHWEVDGQAVYDGSHVHDLPFDTSEDFHTYTLEWTPDFIATYVDGISIFMMDISWDACSDCDEFHNPFYFILNVAVGGGYSQLFTPDDITASLPAQMVVDYIRIYDNGFTELSGSATEVQPTVQPTVAPTELATTVAPTTVSPTTAPTVAPTTNEPTVSSTESPTVAPTDDTRVDEATTAAPTGTPTSSPTIAVTTSPPTVSPTSTPTTSPTASPTTSPATSSPTVAPTSTELPPPREPTSAPIDDETSTPLQRFAAVGIVMTLSNVEPLNPTLAAKWAIATNSHLAQEIETQVGDVEMVDVSIALVSQEPPFVSTRRRRDLQSANQQLVFNAVIAIQSTVEVQDVNPYIVGAFDSDVKKDLYLARLQKTTDDDGQHFDNASVVSVDPASSVSRVQSGTETDPPKDRTGGALLIALVVAGLIVGLTGFIIVTRWRRTRGERQPCSSCRCPRFRGSHGGVGRLRRNDSVSAIDPGTIEEDSLYTANAKHKLQAPSNDSLYNSSIYTNGNDDGSDACTLSQTNSSSQQSNEYNYQEAFRNLQASVADSQSALTTLSSVQATIVNEFQVSVPAGKVGLVLETSNDGEPVVQQVKPDSPMVGQVQVGDRLLKVDERDVSTVIPETVSRIIASKKENPIRHFTFGRPQS